LVVWRSRLEAAPEEQSASVQAWEQQWQAAVRELERQRPVSALAPQLGPRASARERPRQVRAAPSFRAPAVWARPARRDARGS
jgi:hypothetical protein